MAPPASAQASIDKDYMNKLVLEYLIGRGQRQLAEAFWRESATDRELEVDFSDVENRKEVQQHILTGNIARARQGIDQLDSLFLQEHREIDFVLAKQEVIELIKGHNIAEALSFAIKHLAPFGETSEIEQAMALLAFETHACSPLAHLLEQPQRRRVADMVNSALLKRQKNHCDPRLPALLRHQRFLQAQLSSSDWTVELDS